MGKKKKEKKSPNQSVVKQGWISRTLNHIRLDTTRHVHNIEEQIDILNADVSDLKDDFEYARDTRQHDFWNPDRKGPTEEDYLKATHHSPWYYSSVFMTANTIAQLPWRFTVNEIGENGELREIAPPEEPKLAELFRYPDMITKTSWYNLIEGTVQYLECCGNAYWLVFHDENYVKTASGKARLRKADDEFDAKTDVFRIRLLRPDKVEPIRDKVTAALIGWLYKPGKTATIYDIDDVVHFDYFNPVDDFHGLSPATPAWDSIEALRNFDRLNRRLIENDFEFGPMIEPEAGAEVSVSMRLALAEKLKQRHRGPNKIGEPFSVPPGVKIKTLVSPKDIQFQELQRAMILNVSAATGVPPALLGMTDQYNRANMRAIRNAFYKDTIMPKTRRIADKITNHLIPKIDPAMEKMGMKFKFDFSGVEALKESPNDVAVATKHAVGRAWKTVNEARTEIGMHAREDDPSADELYIKETPGMIQMSAAKDIAPPSENDNTSVIEWFDPLEHVDWKRAADSPIDFKIWRQARKALAPIETKVIAEIHKQGARDQDYVVEELQRQWRSLEQRGVLEKAGIYTSIIMKAGPIMPKKEFDRMYGKLEKYIADQDEWMFKVIDKGAKDAMLASAEMHAGALEMGFDFDLYNENVNLYRSIMGDRITFDVTGTTMKAFRDSMYKGYELGEGIDALTDRVNEQLGKLFGKEDWRAELIARTETTSAFNFGAIESYKQADITGTKHWISAFDDGVRDWHIIVPSVKGVNTPFIVDSPNGPATMQYPGDPAGGSENICNCRCTVSIVPE